MGSVSNHAVIIDCLLGFFFFHCKYSFSCCVSCIFENVLFFCCVLVSTLTYAIKEYTHICMHKYIYMHIKAKGKKRKKEILGVSAWKKIECYLDYTLVSSSAYSSSSFSLSLFMCRVIYYYFITTTDRGH